MHAPGALTLQSINGITLNSTLNTGTALSGSGTLLLEGIDRWYRLGTAAAGFCRSCELALIEALRESYGDHFEPFDPLAPHRAQPGSRTAPFAGAREALRLASAMEAVKRAALRARDEARRGRGV